MLPFVRAFTSIVAGLIRVPAVRFGVLSAIGTVLYATALSCAGYALGSAWNSVSHGLTVVGYILFALVFVAIVGFVVYRLRQFRREAAQARPRGPQPRGHQRRQRRSQARRGPAGPEPAAPRRPGGTAQIPRSDSS